MIQIQQNSLQITLENPVRKLVSKARTSKKFTYNMLADKVKISGLDIENFENGAYLHSDIEEKILQALDIPKHSFLLERWNLVNTVKMSKCEYEILGLIAKYNSIPLFLFRMYPRYIASSLVKKECLKINISDFYAKIELTDLGAEKYFELSQYYLNGLDFKPSFPSRFWFGSFSSVASILEKLSNIAEEFKMSLEYTEILSFLIIVISLIASVVTGNYSFVQACCFLSGFALCAKGLSILKRN